MKQLIFKTTNSYAPLSLRVLLAVVLFPHGAQKLLGWFGGSFQGAMNYFTEDLGFPGWLGLLVILIEFFAPVAILFGFATRLWGVILFALFTGIIITTNHTYFFMNWFGIQKSEGMEFFLLAIGMSVSLIVSGSGKLSIDSLLPGNKKTKQDRLSAHAPLSKQQTVHA